mmetsp:Transcript_9200/g.21515  ORF Transcript_9200/g.21515 Transcript_9200/m.21515 type:complete len:468 (+) Transcript_9200:1555-2958(+)
MVRAAVGDFLRDALLIQAGSADFQHLALQRVHARRLVSGDLKVLVVKEINGIHKRGVALDGPGRTKHNLVRFVAEVEVHVEARIWDLHDSITSALQTCSHHLRLVPASAESGVAIHDVDVLVPAGRRRPACNGIEQLGVTFPAGQNKVWRSREETRRHGEHLRFRGARVAVAIRAEEEDGVGLCHDAEAILSAGEGRGPWAVLALEQDIACGRAHEVHSPDKTPTPSAKEITKCLVVRHGEGVVILFAFLQGQAHQCRRALLDALPQCVLAEGLENRSQMREVPVIHVQRVVHELVRLIWVKPHDLPLTPDPEIALLDFLRKSAQAPLIPSFSHRFKRPLDILNTTRAHLQHTEAFLKNAGGYLLGEDRIGRLGPYNHVKPGLVTTRFLDIRGHSHILCWKLLQASTYHHHVEHVGRPCVTQQLPSVPILCATIASTTRQLVQLNKAPKPKASCHWLSINGGGQLHT